jgi:xanthosine utilization system XapX-like protein
MTQASIAIAVALVGLLGALVGLVGVWVGRLMERSNEAMKWRRDRCLEAYADGGGNLQCSL